MEGLPAGAAIDGVSLCVGCLVAEDCAKAGAAIRTVAASKAAESFWFIIASGSMWWITTTEYLASI